MSPFIEAYLFGALTVSYLLMVWFLTGFSLHLVDFIQGLGLWERLWKDYDQYEPATKEDLDMYLQARIGLPMWLELLCCPYCLSFHLSYITAAIICLLAPVSWWLVPVAAFSWPAIANVLFHYVSSNHHSTNKQ